MSVDTKNDASSIVDQDELWGVKPDPAEQAIISRMMNGKIVESEPAEQVSRGFVNVTSHAPTDQYGRTLEKVRGGKSHKRRCSDSANRRRRGPRRRGNSMQKRGRARQRLERINLMELRVQVADQLEELTSRIDIPVSRLIA